MNDDLEDLRQQIRQLREGDDPLLIADLHGRLGFLLGKTAKDAWTEELIGEVLQAYGTALDNYEAASDLPNFLRTLRNIGATYFNAVLAGLGDGVSHLTSATQAYEDLLWSTPPSFDPQERESWQRELDTIRDTAITMWETVLPQLDRDQQAWEWSYAHLCLGGLYRMRRPGDPGENLERAIASLDSALEVLSFETTFDPWLHAHYHRGQAYLFRREGEKAENLAKALESLRITVEHEYLGPDDDSGKWTMVMTQIAQVLVLRNETDAARAVVEKALALDQSLWSPNMWVSAQLLLAGLRIGLTADEDTVAHAPEEWSHDAMTDPFDESGMLEAQAEYLKHSAAGRALRERLGLPPDDDAEPQPKPPDAFDEQWHVPPMLSEDVAHLRRHFDKSVHSASMWPRNAAEREVLERGRVQLYSMMFDHVRERSDAAIRTRALFERVTHGEETFALMLREFHMRAEWFPGVSISWGNWGESLGAAHVAKRIAPMALVWITNPIDSGPIDPDAGYRVESASTWQSDVRKLIAAASFIVMDNDAMTEGVRYEIEALRELGRLDDTLFGDPEKAEAFLGLSVLQLDDDQLDRMHARAKPRPVDPGTLPPAACRWVEGAQREAYEAMVQALLPWVQALPLPESAVAADLVLDALAYVIPALMVLQNAEPLPSLFAMAARALETYSADDLTDAHELARMYAEVVEELETQRLQLF